MIKTGIIFLIFGLNLSYQNLPHQILSV